MGELNLSPVSNKILSEWYEWIDKCISKGYRRGYLESGIRRSPVELRKYIVAYANVCDELRNTTEKENMSEKINYDPETGDIVNPNYKFKELDYLKEVLAYIDATYSEHYASEEPDSPQAFEGIVAAGNGKGFAMGNIQKLSARYGKKEGYNRKDLMKIIHYGVLMLHVHDKREARLKKPVAPAGGGGASGDKIISIPVTPPVNWVVPTDGIIWNDVIQNEIPPAKK